MNAYQRSVIVTVGVVAILAAGAGQAPATIYDHLQCYKITDPLVLQAFVDLDSEQFGLDPNCKVGKAKLFCVPAEKTVLSAEDKKTHLPITPQLLVGHNFKRPTGDRICYKVKCPEPYPPDTEVIDQFGTRTLTKFKTQMLCTPAVKKDEVFAGWLGQIELATFTPGHDGAQYWYDSDGVDPEEPGCHFPFSNVVGDPKLDPLCSSGTDIDGLFGEMCVAGPDVRADIFENKWILGAVVAMGPYLIETNPAQNECHAHKNAVGHPDVYDCDAYCEGEHGPGWTGTCVQVPNHCVTGVHSAYCDCVPPASPSGAFADIETGLLD